MFGKDTPSSHWLCAFLLDKVTFNLSVWSGEESVAVDTVKLLASLVKNRARYISKDRKPQMIQIAYSMYS